MHAGEHGHCTLAASSAGFKGAQTVEFGKDWTAMHPRNSERCFLISELDVERVSSSMLHDPCAFVAGTVELAKQFRRPGTNRVAEAGKQQHDWCSSDHSTLLDPNFIQFSIIGLQSLQIGITDSLVNPRWLILHLLVTHQSAGLPPAVEMDVGSHGPSPRVPQLSGQCMSCWVTGGRWEIAPTAG